MKTVTTACLLALVAACSPASDPNEGAAAFTPEDESAIREQHVAIAAAINNRDAAALARFYTDDADEVFFDRPRTVGPDAIREASVEAFATWPDNQRFTLTVTDIRPLAPDIAIVETLATFSEGEMESNRGTTVMVRQSGVWLIRALRVYPAAATP